MSTAEVKRHIQQLIRQEDKHKPHSDSSLVTELERQGIHISRRTVAKYRAELGIPSPAPQRAVKGVSDLPPLLPQGCSARPYWLLGW